MILIQTGMELTMRTSFEKLGLSLNQHTSSFRVNVNNVFNTLYIAESNTNLHLENDTDPNWNGI
jgi:hypothetical protein